MSVRQLDGNHDWMWGAGRNNYLTKNQEVGQNINTSLNSILGNCFFATNDGIAWFNLLGAKDLGAITLAIRTTILNVTNVTGINSLSVNYDSVTRKLTCTYNVQTSYSLSYPSEFVYDTGTLG